MKGDHRFCLVTSRMELAQAFERPDDVPGAFGRTRTARKSRISLTCEAQSPSGIVTRYGAKVGHEGMLVTRRISFGRHGGPLHDP
jgi:hypothetical protein